MVLKRKKLVLAAILFLGLFLRVYNLDSESLWLDEAISINTAHLNPSQIIENRAVRGHPPLYFFILHCWISLFGDSEFSARFLSLIFGFLAIIMIYKVGKLLFDKQTGILSALILGLSVFHIQYSQEVRGYSLVVLLTLFSFYFFIKLFKKQKLTASIGYVLSSTILIYTHYSGLLIILTQNFYIIILYLSTKGVPRSRLKKWFLLQAILIFLFIPWIGISINQHIKIQSGHWLPLPSIISIIGSFLEYAGSMPLLLFFIILLSFAIFSYEKVKVSLEEKSVPKSIKTYRGNIHFSKDSRIYLLLMWLLTPIIGPFIISKVSAPIYWTRYTIGASLAFYLLAAKGIKSINYRYAKVAIAAAIITFSLVNAYGYYVQINKEQWREVTSFVDINAKPKDLVLFNAGWIQIAFDYYSKRTNIIKKPFPKETMFVNKKNIKELEPVIKGYNRIWLILNRSGDYNKLIKKTLCESYNLLYHRNYTSLYDFNGKYGGIEIAFFRKDNQGLVQSATVPDYSD